ncbi:hypothetical protein AT6N2_C0965 [Agrobacterium tumefaciens]|nr:hypothetical protein AT6N2_C0965 [Agrobacterium tumefaciens]
MSRNFADARLRRLNRACQPSVNPDILAGNIPCSFGCEKCHRGSDFLALAVALHRHRFAALLCCRQAVDPSRQNIVHADIVGRIGIGKDLGVGSEARAEDGGGREHAAGFKSPCRRDVDDRARLLLHHDGRDYPRRANDVHQVDVETRVPLLVGDVENSGPRTVPCTIDQQVDAAEFLERLIRQPLEIVIGLVGACDTDTAQLLRERLPFAGGRQDRKPVTIRGQTFRHSRSHAATSSGYYSHFFCRHCYLLV